MNRRVQVFELDGDFVRALPVAGWEGQSAANKPYITVDSAGHIYVSDPEAGRIVVYDIGGTPLAVIRGEGDSYLQSPSGVLVDSHNRLWVSDAGSHRLLRFPALDLTLPE